MILDKEMLFVLVDGNSDHFESSQQEQQTCCGFSVDRNKVRYVGIDFITVFIFC